MSNKPVISRRHKLYEMGLFETMCFIISRDDSFKFVVGKDTAFTIDEINCTGYKDGINVRDVRFVWPKRLDSHGILMNDYGV